MKRFRFILLFVFFFCSRHRFISTACMANELGVFYETHFFVTTFSPQIKNKYNFHEQRHHKFEKVKRK